jgi:signal transduction histidine kinase
MVRSPNKQVAEMARKIQACQEGMRVLLAAEDAQSARITRMLHDNVGQYVAALQLGLRGLERELEKGADAKLTLQSLHAISQSVGEELHKAALELHPTSLDDHGLVRSLTTFLDDWSLLTKTAVNFDHVAFGEDRLPRHLEANLFRIIRDMLHVVSQQARVSQVSVILRRQVDCLVSMVEHNGKPPDAAGQSCDALSSVKARVALLEGTFTMEDCTISGCTMIARVPSEDQA